MAAGLLAQPLLGVDQQDRGVGARGAGDHVLEELLVARGVDDREGAARGAERDPGRVHRDVLRLLLEEGVHQEGVLELHPLGLAGGLDPLGLAVGHGMGVEEEPADQGRLAVVDVAHDDQWRWSARAGVGAFRARRLRAGLREGWCRERAFIVGHMKPLARSFCIALRSWWSWARPARSEILRDLELLDDVVDRRRVALHRLGDRHAAERAVALRRCARSTSRAAAPSRGRGSARCRSRSSRAAAARGRARPGPTRS